MASYFTLTLDVTPPSNGSISIHSSTNTVNITATLSATGATQMKLYGDITNTTGGSAISEASASWVAYSVSKDIILTNGDGTKTVYVKYRDEVGNETSAYSASTVLDTAGPTVEVLSGPDVATISKVSGFNVCLFTFRANEIITEWTVRVVPDAGSTHDAGAEIPSTGGSTNMHGATQTAADAPISCSIYGADLEAASSGEGAKIIKVFAKDVGGNWSI